MPKKKGGGGHGHGKGHGSRNSRSNSRNPSPTRSESPPAVDKSLVPPEALSEHSSETVDQLKNLNMRLISERREQQERIADLESTVTGRDFDEEIEKIVFTSILDNAVKQTAMERERSAAEDSDSGDKEVIISDLRNRVAELLKIGSEKSELEIQLKSMANQIVSLKSERDSILQQKEEAKESAVQASQEIDAVSFDLGAEKQKSLQQKERIEELEKSLADLTAERDAVLSEKIVLQEKSNELEIEIEELGKKHASVRVEAEQAKKELSVMEEEARKWNSESVMLERIMKDVKEEAEKANQKSSALQQEMRNLLDTHEGLRRKHEVATENAEKLARELLSVSEDLAKAKLELENSNVKLAALENEKLEVTSHNEGLKKEYDAKINEAEQLQKELLVTEMKFKEAQAEVVMLKSNVDALENEKEAASKVDAENSRLVQELELLNERVVAAETERDLVVKSRDALVSEAGSMNDKKMLRGQLEELELKNARLVAEKEALEKLLEAEKLEAEKMRSKILELEKAHGGMSEEVGQLRKELGAKGDKIVALSKELENLKSVTDVQRKSGVLMIWAPLAASVVAAVSLAYAARGR